ncbi:hypothetical protein ACPJHH_13070 [Bacillus altitudinis]|uniref:hypothetical protein n=1 Tax=Bacillus altitudinis TaxID=293387 RepID=UPI003D0E9596
MKRYKIDPSDVSFKLPYQFDFGRMKYIVGSAIYRTASDALFIWRMRLITRRGGRT